MASEDGVYKPFRPWETLNYIMGNPRIASLMDSIGFNLTHPGHEPVTTEGMLSVMDDPNFGITYYDPNAWGEFWPHDPGTRGLTGGPDIRIKGSDKYRGTDVRSPESTLMHEVFHLGDGDHHGAYHDKHGGQETYGFLNDPRNIEAYDSGEFVGPDPRQGFTSYKEQWHDMHHGSRVGMVQGQEFEGNRRDLNKLIPYSDEMRAEGIGYKEYQSMLDNEWELLGQQVYGEDFVQGAHLPFGSSQLNYQRNVSVLMDELEKLGLMDTLSTIYDQRY